jgi:hypothetical protein
MPQLTQEQVDRLLYVVERSRDRPQLFWWQVEAEILRALRDMGLYSPPSPESQKEEKA